MEMGPLIMKVYSNIIYKIIYKVIENCSTFLWLKKYI